MKNKNIVILVIVILVVMGIGLLIYKNNKEQPYSVVYLTTREVYVGKLKTFPELRLMDGYILKTVADITDPTKSNFQLQPMNEALWAPKSGIHLVKDNIIFYGTLMSDSVIAKKLAEQAK